MKDRDEIKELFQKELGNYEAKVDPNIWQGIQSGISSTAATTSAAISTGLKLTITVVSATVITAVSLLVYNALQKDVESKDQSLLQKQTTNQQVNEIKTFNKNKNNNEDVSIASSELKENKQESTQSISKEVETPQQNEMVYEPIDGQETIESSKITDNGKSETVSTITQSKTEELVAQRDELEKEKEFKHDKEVLPKFTPVIVKQENQYVVFTLRDSNTEEVVWDFGDGNLSTQSNPEHFYDKAGTYIVTVKCRVNNQELTKTLEVIVDIEGKISKLPNIFTPNGDGQSDYFFIESKGLKELQVTIMNSRQEVVYQSNNINFKWDGNLPNGTPAPEGNYVYIIVAKDNQDNTLNNYQQLHLSR